MLDDQAQDPETISPEGDRTASDRPRGRNRVLRIPLSGPRHRLLRELAAEVDVRPEQLAAIWLRERIDQHAGATALARAVDELADIRALLPRATGSGQAEGAVGGSSRSRGATARGGRRRADKPRDSLHNEIIAVLTQQGQPMTAAEIAGAIRERGQYTAPRSGNPISGAHVSRRIANPYYRSLFERHGRQVRLASHE